MSRNATIQRQLTDQSYTTWAEPSVQHSSLRASDKGGRVASSRDSTEDSLDQSDRKPTHQRFVLADPVAFRYITVCEVSIDKEH